MRRNEIGVTSDEIPRIRSMFVIFDPRMLPTARSNSFFLAQEYVTTSSGSDVARATVVSVKYSSGIESNTPRPSI